MEEQQPWIDAPPPPPELSKARRRAWIGLGLATTPMLLWGACTARLLDVDGNTTGILMLVALGLSAVGAGFGVASLIAKRTLLGWVAAVAGVLSPFVAFFLAALTVPFSRGRAHRRRGQERVPSHDANETWLDPVSPIDAPEELRDALGEAWRAMAATETASVAAFASFSQQLLALGAPSRFVEDAHLDALDEVRHARTCYAIAAGFDGRRRGPAPFAAAAWPIEHTPSFARLARDCLRDGCVFEGASARVARELAVEATPEVASALATIADDEARHAAHAWEVLAWARAKLDARDAAALERVLDEVEAGQHAGVVEHARFETFGVAGSARWREAVCATAREARARLRGELARAA
ncbi:MAG: hypothetical protein H6722_07615 [Sandaracinus sp.]|nr:hypothetical protein [Sandaracinus sp.]MCB9612305.1 hypothetical protein [Sandaracinus sp.]